MTAADAHEKARGALLDDHRCRARRGRPRRVEPARRRLEALQRCGYRIVDAEDGDVADGPAEGRGELGATARHPERDGLEHDDRAVAVDHEPRQRVGLAPHQPGGARTARARGEGGGEPPLPELRVDRLVGPGEKPAAERRARVEEAAADEPAARIDDGHDAARLDVRDVGHVALEDPRMHARPVVSALEPQNPVCHGAQLTGTAGYSVSRRSSAGFAGAILFWGRQGGARRRRATTVGRGPSAKHGPRERASPLRVRFGAGRRPSAAGAWTSRGSGAA